MQKITFKERVFRIVRHIPKGRVATYKQIAKKAGNPKASRAVGAILKINYDPRIPCHRVIRSNGRLGGYNRGKRKKFLLLRKEGFRGFARDKRATS